MDMSDGYVLPVIPRSLATDTERSGMLSSVGSDLDPCDISRSIATEGLNVPIYYSIAQPSRLSPEIERINLRLSITENNNLEMKQDRFRRESSDAEREPCDVSLPGNTEPAGRLQQPVVTSVNDLENSGQDQFLADAEDQSRDDQTAMTASDQSISPELSDHALPGSKSPSKSNQLSSSPADRDMTYWEKRKKNNESAKRSRDSRRVKEEQIAIRVIYLEQENLQLKTEAVLLRNEIEKLKSMLYR